MDLGAITAEGDWNEDNGADDHSYKTSDELFFAAPDYEEIQLCEEPRVNKYWESGLTIESLDALRLGRRDHTRSMGYHFNTEGI